MARPQREDVSSAEIQPYELDLIRNVARRFRTQEPEDLEADLALLVLKLKQKPPTGVRNWKAYLAKLLYNKASNWVRDHRAREARNVSFSRPAERPGEESETLETFVRGPPEDHDLQLAFNAAWNELDPELQQFWKVLLEEQGNQVAAAQRLRKHRNTVRLWIQKMQRILNRHGLSRSLRKH